MIYDKIENMGKYPLLEKVEAFLNEHKGQILENGKYILDENCYLAVSEYETGAGKDHEAHREYIDVQMLLKGREYIFVQDIQKGTPATEYNEQKDIIFYKAENGVAYELNDGNFLVLDTNDLHKPCVMIEQPEKVKKYVFKIKKV
jgi:YhcH/YjgK/YiaL family protein